MEIDPMHVIMAVAVIFLVAFLMKGQGPNITASHILVKEEATAKQISEAFSQLKPEEVPEKFKQLAREKSMCPSGQGDGGSLGTFGLNVMDPIFEAACIKAQIGVPTEPVHTQFGFHIILVHARSGF
eukprot:TRINITY_DN6534_c0_g1_i1.p1 TRINITY_DN6534_c0_g1~~TRINITY_DN6534_c0_g1_i1.p1  ORF type:complete len:149 (+),score=39.40 TRINITY_DN6534_c0_g1_i1:67-447(+)